MSANVTQTYSLAHLSAQDLPPPQLVDMAARVGFDHVGMRLIPPAPGLAAYPLMDDARGLRETRQRLADTGVSVWDIEIVALGRDFSASRFLPFLGAGAELGARAVLVVAGQEDDKARLSDSFASLCEAAAPFGLSINLEFTPWTLVPDANTALAVWQAAGMPANGGILVDAIHVERSITSLADVAALPRQSIHYVQLCDAPAGIPDEAAEILRQARYERKLPGDGGIDLPGLLQVLPGDVPLALEAWDEKRTRELGYEAWARRGLDGMRNARETALRRATHTGATQENEAWKA